MTATFTDPVTVPSLSASGSVTASGGFTGNLVGNVTGNSTGTHTGPVVGDVTGNANGAAFGQQVITGDSAITLKTGHVAITKGSAAAITIAAPTAGTDDGKVLMIVAETAFAHVVTCSSNGFDDKGASGTLTWTAAKGNSVILIARNGRWWVCAPRGVAVA